MISSFLDFYCVGYFYYAKSLISAGATIDIAGEKWDLSKDLLRTDFYSLNSVMDDFFLRAEVKLKDWHLDSDEAVVFYIWTAYKLNELSPLLFLTTRARLVNGDDWLFSFCIILFH